MSTVLTKPLMTTAEMLALPKNGARHWLIRGELRENERTRHHRLHSLTETNVAYYLKAWLLNQPRPRGQVMTGEAGFRLRKNPDSTVGIDLAYVSAELAAVTPINVFLVDGPPTLAVEILSPSNSWEEVTDKVQEYLAVGVSLIWILDPVFHTVQVYGAEAKPVMFNDGQELSGDPHLPGFRVAVADLFAP